MPQAKGRFSALWELHMPRADCPAEGASGSTAALTLTLTLTRTRTLTLTLTLTLGLANPNPNPNPNQRRPRGVAYSRPARRGPRRIAAG